MNKKYTFIIGVAVLAMELVVPDPDVGAGGAVAQLNVAHATLETTQVVEQTEAFNDHRSAAAWK